MYGHCKIFSHLSLHQAERLSNSKTVLTNKDFKEEMNFILTEEGKHGQTHLSAFNYYFTNTTQEHVLSLAVLLVPIKQREGERYSCF